MNVPVEDHRVSVLLVDDQPGKLLAHEAILTEIGAQIVTANNGHAALECLLRHDFAVILLDVNMPDIDGFELAALIRQRPRLEHTPILFITGYSTSDLDRMRGYDIGAADYLFLPVLPEVLRAKVRVFVELARQRETIRAQAERLAQHNQQQQEQIATIQGQIRVIQDLNQQLLAANQELEAFSYSVSHDLRSPLRAMQGYSQALLEDYAGKLAGDGEDYLRRISRAATRLDALIQDILAYSRIAKETMDTDVVDVTELVDALAAEFQTNLNDMVRVTVRHPLHNVRAHRAYLGQCLSNLLDNAAKFVAPGVTPEIEVWTEEIGNVVRIHVQDNGIGIDPAHFGRIFKMFGRLHSQAEYEGTGIGLSIVRKAAERMGGCVGLRSAPGQGSVFYVELPAPRERS